MEKQTYAPLQLIQAAVISRVTYDQWRARRIIKSTADPDKSAWTRYTLGDVLRVAVLARLVRLGFSVSVAEMFLNVLDAYEGGREYLVIHLRPGDEEISRDETYATIQGGHGEIVSERKLRADLANYDASAVVPLHKVRASVVKALKRSNRTPDQRGGDPPGPS